MGTVLKQIEDAARNVVAFDGLPGLRAAVARAEADGSTGDRFWAAAVSAAWMEAHPPLPSPYDDDPALVGCG